MSKLTRFAAPLLAAVAVLAAGCGGGKPETGTVTGEVTWEGQPLKDGLIKFTAADGKPGGDATIKDGKYSATVLTGDMKVSISANKVIGKKKMYETSDSPTVDVTEELIPPKYNVQTELSLTVAKGTQEAKKFELKK